MGGVGWGMTATQTPTARADEPVGASRAAIARERVHGMESLAAVIAHELRAGVLGITSATQLLRYSVPADPLTEKSLGRILHEAERLAGLHEVLTEYATTLPPRLSTGDPDVCWADAIRAMRGSIEATRVHLTHSGANSVTVRLDREELTRAFERALLHVLTRLESGAEADVVSSVDGGWWASTISVRSAEMLQKGDGDRPALLFVLAQRMIVVHGGEVTDHAVGDDTLLMTIRLPLSLQPE
jgi:hypothetical protein